MHVSPVPALVLLLAIGPACSQDSDALGMDLDADGITDAEDAFPDDPDEQVDTDGDGVGDNADAFPDDPDEQADTDGDGVGDNADAFPDDPDEQVDTDGDGVGDNADLCGDTPDPGQGDLDGDGLGDACDADIDGDGAPGSAGDCDDTDASVVPGDLDCPFLGGWTSCAAALASGATEDGVYRLDPDGTGPLGELTALCDMHTDGGGWTLVSVGIESSVGGTDWNNRTDVVNLQHAGTRGPASWKYGDDVIRALTTETYRLVGSGYTEATRYVDATCSWAQNGSVTRDPACYTCYLDPDKTMPDAPHVSLHSWWYGMACGTGVIVTAHAGVGDYVYWVLALDGHPLDANADGVWETCDGQPGVHRSEIQPTSDCDLSIWVR